MTRSRIDPEMRTPALHPLASLKMIGRLYFDFDNLLPGVGSGMVQLPGLVFLIEGSTNTDSTRKLLIQT